MRIRSAALGALLAAAGVLLAPPAGAEPADPAPAPDPRGTSAAAPAAGDGPATSQGVPHLPSLDNLPPGASAAPPSSEGRGVSYLRDLWHAVQTQEISGAGALLLLTQRPMNPDSAPPGVPSRPLPPPSATLPEPAAAPEPALESEPAPAP